MKKILFLFLLILSVSLPSSAADVDYSSQVQPGKWLRNVIVKTEYMGETSSVKIQIYFPKNYTKGKKLRTIIALHQYANNEKDWETGASIESSANKYNMVIVCPDMNKSVYETNYYPETTYKWNVIPGGKFLGETLIKFLNDNFSLALKKENTGIAGVIAGAHGAILTACQYPDKFGAAAGISGYYDPTILQNSKMIEAVYGSYKNFQTRWENDDNPLMLAERLKGVHVYLYHGLKQDAYQPGQSQLMAIKLKQLQKKSPEYSIVYKANKFGAYGWLYWRGQVPEMMEFMNEKLAE
jgi:S-formylglutathione hydrolase FrmB